jgi:ABC-type Fe3+ transport system permease subunit
MAGLLLLALLLFIGIIDSSAKHNERKHQVSVSGHGYTDKQPSTGAWILAIIVLIVCCYAYTLGVHQ